MTREQALARAFLNVARDLHTKDDKPCCSGMVMLGALVRLSYTAWPLFKFTSELNT
jgi:hypothetical protein